MRLWEEAGGEAVWYDMVEDPARDLLDDAAFWKRELGSPADLRWWGVLCTCVVY